MASIPPTSIVIVSRNRPRLLRETIESIVMSDSPAAEIVVVDQSDNAQPDVTMLGRDDFSIRYLHSRDRGLSRGRNAGVAAAAHDILVFIDDDMLVRPRWLRSLVGALVEAGDGAVTTGRVIPGRPEAENAARVATVMGEQPVVYTGRQKGDVLAGGHMAIRRSTLMEIGGWDERLGAGSRFPAAEDNDLGFRLLDRGIAVIYVPQAELIHRTWRSSGHYFPNRWHYGRGKGGFYTKHLKRAPRYMLRRICSDFEHRLRRLPANVFRRPGFAAADAIYCAGIVAGSLEWMLSGRRRKPA
jgi:GT2 family glycosyltransferase